MAGTLLTIFTYDGILLYYRLITVRLTQSTICEPISH